MKNSIFVKICMTSVAAVTASAAIPNMARAQKQDTAFALEEIVVTARRRSESLQDIPGTVTALTKTTLERAGVQRAADFIALTPGVTMVDAAEVGDTQVNIRGLNGTRDAENSFAYIVDGVLYTNPAAFNREYTNLQQIEIFKGPQGAIYGRNAAAGAILVTTSAPNENVEGTGTVSFSEDNTYLIKGSVSGPVIEDKVFGRISADWRKSDGFYRNSFQNNAPIVDAYEGYNINGRLIIEASENLSIDMKIRYGEVDASSITFNSTFNLPVFAGALATPSAFQDVNDFDFLFHANIISDNDQKSFEYSTKFDYDMEGMTLTGWVLYSDIKNNLISDGTSAAFGFFNGDAACQQSVTDLNAAGQTLLGPQFIGTSPVGVIFDPINGSFLGAYTPTTCDGIQEQQRDQSDISAELRLASSGDGDLRWMAGVYFLDIDRQVGVSLNRDSGNAPIRGLFQETGPNATASLTYDDFDSQVFAVFAQLEYDVTNDVELSLALRFDTEKRGVSSLVPNDVRQSVIDLNGDGTFNDPLNPGLSFDLTTIGSIPDKERTFSQLEPKVAITWDATDDVTVFASWGVGFKAGGFNNSGSQATIDGFINGFVNGGIGIFFADDLGVPLPVITDDFEKETSNAFELGFNAQFFDGRLQMNGAGYYTRVTDMQFFEFFVGSFGLLRVVSNIDTVDIYGLEFGFTGHLSEHFRVFGGANYTDSEIKANSSRIDTVGNKSPYTPDYTINIGSDFDYPVTDNINFVARVDAQFIGQTWFHTVQKGQRPTIFQPLFELGFGTGAGGLGTADFSNARRDSYYTVNLRGGFEGENWSLMGFVSNLTDEKYLEEVIPAPEFGGSFNHPGSQRRYGVELSFKF